MLVAQSQAEVMQQAASTTCSKMFKKFVVDTTSTRIDCEERDSVTSWCQANCLDPTHRLSFGSPETVICKNKKAQPGGAKVKKASFRCTSPDVEQTSNSSTDKCGELNKFGITIGEGVKPNCKGLACFPQCDDPNKMPNFQKLACIKKKGKQSVVPNGLTLQCVDKNERTKLGKCGDVLSKKTNKIDETVQVTCFERYCKLDCKSADHEFDPASKKFESTFIRCGKTFTPKKIVAKCVPKTNEKTVTAQGGPPEPVSMKCKPDVFTKYQISENRVNANCTSGKCTLRCKNGEIPNFTWPDGKQISKEHFVCKKNGKWFPPSGTVHCP